MSLLATLSSVAALATPPESRPPIPYTGDGSITFSDLGTAGADMTSQLGVTTAESTLMSLLTLISQSVGTNKWCAHRPAKPGTRPDEEPVVVTAQENLAVKLWNRPNKWMTGAFMRTMCTWHRAAVGEAWIVVSKIGNIPVALWPVRPDRMTPLADPDKYLTGYMYRGPSGEKVPLGIDEVLRLTFPHPTDPHRGLGPVQALLTGLGTSMAAQQWIAAFFRNDASPGGIIEMPEGLEDNEFEQVKRRWNEQHRGYTRAHRVAILEYGKWVARQMSIKDMQFTEVRTLTRDQILEAYRIHKHMMGISEDVNRANAEAADATYGRRTDNPLLLEWQELANGPYVEMFGDGGRVDFQFDNPIPEDKEDQRADQAARIDGAIKLIGAGVDPADAFETMGLPPMRMAEAPAEPEPAEDTGDGTNTGQNGDNPEDAPGINAAAMEKATALGLLTQKLYLGVEGGELWTRTEGRQLLADAGAEIVPDEWDADPKPAPVFPPPGPEDGGGMQPDPEHGGAGDGQADGMPDHEGEGMPSAHVRRGIRAQDSPGGAVDLSQLDAHWQRVLDDVVSSWGSVTADQYDALVGQVRAAIDDGDISALAALEAPDAGATTLLTDAMVIMAQAGAAAVAAEAGEQGVTQAVSQVVPKRSTLKAYAEVVTQLMRASLAASAGREALRVYGPDTTPDAVAAAVRTALEQLTDAQPRMYLGGALTSAANQGRADTLAEAPPARYFASEQLDANTCVNCRQIDGAEFDTLAEAVEQYPMGAYRKCLGREKCRGAIVAIWEVE